MSTVVFNPFPMPTYVMAKPIGSACNLNCRYCYYLEKSKLYENRKSFLMSNEVLEKYIQSYIESQPVPEILFTWHGGEPLLRDMTFFQKLVRLQHRFGRGRKIDNTLQTNGTLLNDSWCRFFKDHNFLIGISIDGPEHCHDHYRKNRKGEGSFREVMRGIELLHKNSVEFNTLSVINDYNVNFPLEIYRFFKMIGSRFMQFSPIVERITHGRPDKLNLASYEDSEGAELAAWSVKPKLFGEFYISIFDEWVRNDVGQYYVQLFDATLARTVGQQAGVCLFSETCGHASAMEFNGDVYACDHFVFPEYKRGNIKQKTIYEMMFSPEQLQFGANKKERLTEQCKACEFLKLCNGECPKNRIRVLPNEKEKHNYLCEGYKAYFTHTKPYMDYMANQLYSQRPPANVMTWAKSQMR